MGCSGPLHPSKVCRKIPVLLSAALKPFTTSPPGSTKYSSSPATFSAETEADASLLMSASGTNTALGDSHDNDVENSNEAEAGLHKKFPAIPHLSSTPILGPAVHSFSFAWSSTAVHAQPFSVLGAQVRLYVLNTPQLSSTPLLEPAVQHCPDSHASTSDEDFEPLRCTEGPKGSTMEGKKLPKVRFFNNVLNPDCEVQIICFCKNVLSLDCKIKSV